MCVCVYIYIYIYHIDPSVLLENNQWSTFSTSGDIDDVIYRSLH